jgi:ribosome-associated heat shock protein Hsp15
VHERLLVWKILDPGARRGPAPEAALLYEDLSPAPLPKADKTARFIARDLGSGRPTKKDRRDTDRLRSDED